MSRGNTKTAWEKFPHADKAFIYAGAALKKRWERLHCGDREPFPTDPAVQEAWRLYHNGEFQAACEAGLVAGLDGYKRRQQGRDDPRHLP
jgi:hypothetical protein